MSTALHLTPTPNGGFADNFQSLSPIIRLHIKKLFISGSAKGARDIVQRVIQLDPDIKQNEALDFVEQNSKNPVWLSDQKDFLDRQYQRMLADQEKITEHIDHVYDAQFLTPIRDLVDRRIKQYEQMDDEDFPGLPTKELKTLTETTNLLYNAQRQARGLAGPAASTAPQLPPFSGPAGVEGEKGGTALFKNEVLKVVEAETQDVQEVTALEPL